MELTFLHYVLAFLAIAINALQKVNKRKRKKLPIDFLTYIKKNWVAWLISVLSIVALFIMANDFLQLLSLGSIDGKLITVLTNATLVLAFIIGWFNFSLLKFGIGIFKKKVPVKETGMDD